MFPITATAWRGLRDPQGKRFSTTWPRLVQRLSVPRVVADKHDAPGLSLATYAGDRRALAAHRLRRGTLMLRESRRVEAFDPQRAINRGRS